MLGLRSEAPSFTKNKCSFVMLLQSTDCDISFDLITSLRGIEGSWHFSSFADDRALVTQ